MKHIAKVPKVNGLKVRKNIRKYGIRMRLISVFTHILDLEDGSAPYPYSEAIYKCSRSQAKSYKGKVQRSYLLGLPSLASFGSEINTHELCIVHMSGYRA